MPYRGRTAASVAAVTDAASRGAEPEIAVLAPFRQHPTERGEESAIGSVETPAVAAADEAPTADGAERATRHPWRARCGSHARATAAASRTRDTRKKGASTDAPRARRRRHREPESSFGTSHDFDTVPRG